MKDQDSNGSDDEQRLDDWLDELEQAHESGHPVQPEDVCQDSRLLADLRASWDRLVRINGWLQAASDTSLPLQDSPADRESPDPAASRVIGPYKLLQEIGEGGMGVVWMAEQSEPIKRRVALKLIRGNFAGKKVIARFEAERQALAMMDHPNIARVLDAGATEAGLPYFVMELVEGIPITKYCDQKRLTIHERLELFIQVCDGIQHAHTKGIIHRDIKPGNVLVTQYDRTPVAKVIDFGIAKAMEAELTDKTLFTEFGQVMGTYLYMSPEQAEMNALAIDTRTDVFALGVLLHELLTGETPVTKRQFEEAAGLQILHLIRSQEPSKASERVSTSSNEKVITKRGLNRHQLATTLRGDLDAILMVATANERDRRYKTAESLSSDVQRFLSGDMVTARAPSPAYRFRKLVARNRGLVTFVTAVIVLLIAAIAGTSYGLLEAEEKATLARESEAAAIDSKGKEVAARRQADKIADSARDSEMLARFKLANARWDTNRAADAKATLQTIPPEYRDFEWHFCNRHFLGSYMTLYGHHNKVMDVAFSPDGEHILSASFDGVVKIWDGVMGRELRTLKADLTHTSCLAVDPSGTRIASGGHDSIARVWNLATGEQLVEFEGHKETVITDLAFSPDGKRVATAGGADDTVKIWNAQSGDEIETLRGHTGLVVGVAFSPDGQHLASVDYEAVRIWDANSFEELMVLRGHRAPLSSAAFSPDGVHIASCGHDETVRIWNISTGEELLRLHSDTQGGTHCLTFSPDGRRLAAGGIDRQIRIWEVKSGELVASLKGHAAIVNGLTFSTHGDRLVSGSMDGTIKVWKDLMTSGIDSVDGNQRSVKSVAFSPDGTKVISAGSDKTVMVWDGQTGEELLRLEGHLKGVNSVAYSPDGLRIASGSDDRTVRLWDANLGDHLATLNGHTGSVLSVCFSPTSDQLASASVDHTVRIWNTNSSRQIFTLRGHDDFVHDVKFIPGGEQVVSASSDKTVKFWDIRSGKGTRSLLGHSSGIKAAAFYRGNRPHYASVGESIKIWDFESGAELNSFVTAYPHAIAYKPGSSRIAVGSYKKTELWDADSGEEIVTLGYHKFSVKTLQFRPDGKRLVTGSYDGNIWIWNGEGGHEAMSLRPVGGEVISVRFSGDSSKLAVLSGSNYISVWDVNTGLEIDSFQSKVSPVHDLAFSTDGKSVYSISEDGVSAWHGKSGKRIQTNWSGPKDDSSISPDGRWLAVPFSSDVSLVDLWYKDTPKETAYRMAKARSSMFWHTTQAEEAKLDEDWYAATYHFGVLVGRNPTADNVREMFYCYEKLSTTEKYRVPAFVAECLTTYKDQL